MNPQTERSNVPSLLSALVAGTAWSVAMRWLSRLIGIASIAVCARILTPSDYGLVAMAMVAIGFSNVLVEFGIDAALIRNQQAVAVHYDTAWSLRIIQCTTLSVLIMLSAPVAAHIFKDERVMAIMFAVGTASFIGGFQNIYVVDFRKHLDFKLDFLFTFIPRLIAFAVTIVSVLWLESYWGLVFGICSTEVSRVLLSYMLSKKRGRWRLTEWRDLTGFSIWYFLRGLAEFFTYQFDRLLIGALGGARMLGIYATAREIAALPATELVDPISRALIPTLSKLNGLRERQAAAIAKALSGTMLVSAPISLGFATIAPEFVSIMFGSKWLDVVPLIPVICISALTSGFRTTALNILVVADSVRNAAVLTWLQTIVSMSVFFPAFHVGGLVGITIAYAVIGVFMMAIQGVYLHRRGLLRGSTLWIDLIRPLTAAVVMYLCIEQASSLLPDIAALSMICKIVIGAIVYTTSIALMWLLMGSPNSSEKQMFDLVVDRFKGARSK